jgi:hypothetical protein
MVPSGRGSPIRQLQLAPSAGRDFRILPPKTFLISRFLSKKKNLVFCFFI